MNITIYVDLLILENFLVNFFLIYVTTRTVRIDTNFKKISIAAFLGALSCVLILFFRMDRIVQLIFKASVAIGIMLVVYYKKPILDFVKSTVIFVMYSIFLAGMCIFVQFSEAGNTMGSGFIVDFSYKKLLLSMMIVFILLDRIIIYIKDRMDLHKLIYEVDIYIENSKESIKAFLDTGNELREPVTNLPVIVVEEEIFNNFNFNKEMLFEIPYKVVDGGNGNLKGIKPREVKIHIDKEKMETREVIIAFCENKLSNKGDFNALLSRGVLL